ncbi:MAG: chromate transporter [Ignisphaera sp.]|nr:chromate transporter [Ignisphaera sp.]MCX8167633.1 chromate transporter [Ignisphaera sp.]MDW8085956.1 chromate transporter [Ignisphaera sp.]
MNLTTLFTIFITFLKIGSVMFGGGYAMIPILKHEVVDRNRWLSEDEFVDVIAIAESTPGPIAINSATYIGYKLGGVPGAVLATIGVVMPAFTVILTIATILTTFYHHIVTKSILFGIRAAVVGLIAAALITVIRGVFKELNVFQTIATMLIAIAIFISVVKFGADPIVMILISAAVGLALGVAGFI